METPQPNQVKVALKVFNSEYDSVIKKASKEFAILSQVSDHPHFVKVLDFKHRCGHVEIPNCLPESQDDQFAPYRAGSTSVNDATHISMEFCEFGDIFDIVKATGGFKNLDLVKFLFSQVLNGVNHLHLIGYSHLDLKLENILVGNDYKLKLCDLGFACKTSKQVKEKRGTESFMAPEILTKDSFSTYEGRQADIFSLGVILFILFFGQPPFHRADVRIDRFYGLCHKKPEAFFRLHPTIKRVKQELELDSIDQGLIDLL